MRTGVAVAGTSSKVNKGMDYNLFETAKSAVLIWMGLYTTVEIPSWEISAVYDGRIQLSSFSKVDRIRNLLARPAEKPGRVALVQGCPACDLKVS